MFSLTQVLIPIALLSSAVWGLPLAQESNIDDLSLDLPVSKFGFPLDDENRIFGGQEASKGQFPHQISLRLRSNDYEFRHICGGSIISDRFILTAGHCYDKEKMPFLYRVIVGAHRKDGDDGVSYWVERWIVHENSNMSFTPENSTIRNDIALIETVNSIKFNNLIAPISLQRHFIDGEAQALTSGWGRSNDGVTNLKYVNVETLNNTVCRDLLGHFNPTPAVHDWDTICVTTKRLGHGVCKGDSGGPLESDKRLIGITSWARGCGIGNPDGFTRVSTYIMLTGSGRKLSYRSNESM